MEGWFSTEEFSMAVAACCASAFVLGFVIGFLVNKHWEGGDVKHSHYHVSEYLHKPGYEEENVYAKVDDMIYYPVSDKMEESDKNIINTDNTTNNIINNSDNVIKNGFNNTDNMNRNIINNALFAFPASNLEQNVKYRTLNLHPGRQPGHIHGSNAFGTVNNARKVYL